jgi:UPF0176 protein
MGKILLYYKYIRIDNPQAVVKEQRALCESLGLKGRILIGTEGLNGTVGGTTEATETYKKAMESHPLFNGIEWKESPGGAEYFPRLRIVAKKEIVHLGVDPEDLTPQMGGDHLTPEQVHQLLDESPDDLVVLDARNAHESAIGTFRNAITPDIKHFRDFPDYVDEHLDTFKDKKVLMFCTGGIRCERATGYLKQKNVAKQVMQIQGGIHKYAEQYPEGHFRGKNYVFDGRIALKVNDDVLSSCSLCNNPCDTYTNCLNVLCNKHFICCDACLALMGNTCTTRCKTAVQAQTVKTRGQLRPMPLPEEE